MTDQQKQVLLDCRNMLNHLIIIYNPKIQNNGINEFDCINIRKRIEQADKILFDPIV